MGGTGGNPLHEPKNCLVHPHVLSLFCGKNVDFFIFMQFLTISLKLHPHQSTSRPHLRNPDRDARSCVRVNRIFSDDFSGPGRITSGLSVKSFVIHHSAACTVNPLSANPTKLSNTLTAD